MSEIFTVIDDNGQFVFTGSVMRIAVYKNLHKDCWSMTNKGLVVGHSKSMILKDPKFRVGPKGRERVIREKRKNVHARIYGDMAVASLEFLTNRYGAGVPVSYDPYEKDSFYVVETKKPIFEAEYVYFKKDGKVVAFGINK